MKILLFVINRVYIYIRSVKNKKKILIISLLFVFALLFLFLVEGLNRSQIENRTKALNIPSSGDNKVFVQTHIWYSTGENIYNGPWGFWNKANLKTLGNTPATTFGNPWTREIANRLSYPLTGPYSSKNLDIIRYQYLNAKAAGIDGFFISTFTRDLYPTMDLYLDIANEKNFPVGLELWVGPRPDRPNAFGGNARYEYTPNQADGCVIRRNIIEDWLVETIIRFKNKPGYLRINGKPAVWLVNGYYSESEFRKFWPNSDCTPRSFYSWGNVDELNVLFDKVEERISEDIYVVMSVGPTDFTNNSKNFSDVPQIGKIAVLDNLGVFYNLFGLENQITRQLNSTTDKQRYESYMRSEINRFSGLINGSKMALRAFPGFDERGFFPPIPNSEFERGTKPRQVVTRDANGMYEKNDGFLKSQLDFASEFNQWVFLESWNDYAESTQIEPSLNMNNFVHHGDPFSPLRRIASHKGISNPQFTYPPTQIVDDKLKEYDRNKQYGGEKVKVKIGIGYKKDSNYNIQDRLRLKILFADDQFSRTDPSYNRSIVSWGEHSVDNVNYTSSIKNYEIDITKILDTPSIVWGLNATEHNIPDIYLTKLVLDWYGKEINLLDPSIASNLYWHNEIGNISWGQDNASGVLKLENNILLEDNIVHNGVLKITPKFKSQSNEAFTHLGVNFNRLDSYLKSTYTPTSQTSSSTISSTVSSTISSTNSSVSSLLLKADLNKDRRINLLDFIIFKSSFGRKVCDLEPDFNNDCKVNLADFLMFKSVFRKSY